MYKLSYKNTLTDQTYSLWFKSQDDCINLEAALLKYPYAIDVNWSYEENNK